MGQGGRRVATVASAAAAACILGMAILVAPAAATCRATWASVPPRFTSGNPVVNDVATFSPTNSWAVGDYANSPQVAFALHWDGTAWHSTSLPIPTGTTILMAVGGSAGSDLWAVGSRVANSVTTALMFHWNGLSWTRVSLPNASGVHLTDVSAATTTDAWAVGDNPNVGPIAYHWDGATWTTVTPVTPPLWAPSSLLGVDDLAPNDAYALQDNGPLYRYTAPGWTAYPPPGGGLGIDDALVAISDTDVLMVGYDVVVGSPSNHYTPSVELWNGSSWVDLDNAVNPNPVDTLSINLQDVASASSTGTWSVGFRNNGNSYLAEEYDGSAWTVVSPKTTNLNSALAAVDTAGGAIMAVGNDGAGAHAFAMCPIPVNDSKLGSGTVGMGQAAYFVANRQDAHAQTVQDATAMGLFSSGSLDGGAIYHTTTLEAAGTYPTIDTANSASGSVAVPMAASRTAGPLSTKFTIVWAAQTAPAGYVYDVVIRRPGGTVFHPWKPGTTAHSATFTADKGAGTYRFEARLRKVAGGETRFSPTLAITVT